MKITLIKKLNGNFIPAYESDYENAKKITINEPFEYEYKKLRNYKFHKKFFALLNLVYDNQERYINIEHFRHDLIIEAGYYEIRYNFQGVEVYVAKSISFAKMDEIEFNELYSKCIDVIIKYFNFNKQDIIDNIEQYF
jgi:hypothetical protein